MIICVQILTFNMWIMVYPSVYLLPMYICTCDTTSYLMKKEIKWLSKRGRSRLLVQVMWQWLTWSVQVHKWKYPQDRCPRYFVCKLCLCISVGLTNHCVREFNHVQYILYFPDSVLYMICVTGIPRAPDVQTHKYTALDTTLATCIMYVFHLPDSLNPWHQQVYLLIYVYCVCVCVFARASVCAHVCMHACAHACMHILLLSHINFWPS